MPLSDKLLNSQHFTGLIRLISRESKIHKVSVKYVNTHLLLRKKNENHSILLGTGMAFHVSV